MPTTYISRITGSTGSRAHRAGDLGGVLEEQRDDVAHLVQRARQQGDRGQQEAPTG